MGDPRLEAAGLGNLAWFDMVDERYDDMLANASASLEIAIAPQDIGIARLLKGMALVFTGRIDEGVDLLWSTRARYIAVGWTYVTSASDMALGPAMVLQGEFERGVRLLEAIIETDIKLGFVVGRDMARMILTEVYLEFLAPTRPVSIRAVLGNLPFLVRTKFAGWKKAMGMMLAVRENPMFSGTGYWLARAEANLGFLYMIKKRYVEAKECFARARPIAEEVHSTALLAKIDAALARIPALAGSTDPG